jgi:hypothetical protein
VGQGPCFSSHFRVVPPRGGAGATRVTLGGWVPACLALQEDRTQVMSTAPVAVAAAAVGDSFSWAQVVPPYCLAGSCLLWCWGNSIKGCGACVHVDT